MLRPITGYHTDDAKDWVAELSCGHGQHVRHKPPFLSRPWVLTSEDRDAMLGTELDCVRCDRLEMPDGLSAYKRTAEFDEGTIPGGLRKNHATKAGVWGVIHVISGQLRYRIDGPGGRDLLLNPETPGIIPPEALHHVEPDGPVRFFVEFRKNGA
ncbi:DUF3565 domain-containing protein [Sorangium sp. So ce1078]|uniref:DUF3565 domain-containing protein n=1 Tax=Sorangium sp. So ce1078 TaxID=3133329 RepID=UPI003F5DE0F8